MRPHPTCFNAVSQIILFCLTLTLFTGCATSPYPTGQYVNLDRYYEMPEGEPQIEVGRPNGFLDTVGWIVGIPGKIILLNHRIDNHRVSEETISEMQAYLDFNKLDRVKVRVNQYRPGGEWKRLFKNRHTSPVWRYTLGVLSTAFYTILPQRVFGGDNYNPYTNTISLYSDIPAVALHEGGHAKDAAQRTYKGTYAALYILPLVPLYHEAVASNDAVSYLYAQEGLPLQKQGYNTLYPAYGTYIGGTAADWITSPWNYAATLAGAIPGHIVGRIKSANLD